MHKTPVLLIICPMQFMDVYYRDQCKSSVQLQARPGHTTHCPPNQCEWLAQHTSTAASTGLLCLQPALSPLLPSAETFVNDQGRLVFKSSGFSTSGQLVREKTFTIQLQIHFSRYELLPPKNLAEKKNFLLKILPANPVDWIVCCVLTLQVVGIGHFGLSKMHSTCLWTSMSPPVTRESSRSSVLYHTKSPQISRIFP